MTPDDALLRKAERYIRSAILLVDDGDIDSAASRLYYAMFYTVEALLAVKGKSFSSHHAIIAAFGQEFAKTHELDPKFHRILLSAFDKRNQADYDSSSRITALMIDEMVADAKAFLAEARQWLAMRPPSNANESQL